MTRPRTVIAASSLALLAAVVVLALAYGPAGSRAWLLVFGVLAVATAVPSVTSEPRDLLPALVFGLPPVVALVSDGSPTWLIAPLAVLLLVAAELNALSWECEGAGATSAATPRRLVAIVQLGALGLGASFVVGAAARVSWLGGTSAVVVAGAAITGLAYVVAARADERE